MVSKSRRHNLKARLMILALAATGILQVVPPAAAATLSNGMSATSILGKTGFNVDPSTNSQALNFPVGSFYDAAHNRLFVSDTNNNRVLVFAGSSITNGQAAVNVLGQANFSTNTAAATISGMSSPRGLAFDAANQRLFIADFTNHRVLVYDVNSITDGEDAVKVLGQSTFTAGSSALTQTGMNGPNGLAYDSANQRLFVADDANRRVLVYDVNAISNGEPAVNVLGQANFTSAAIAVTQAGMTNPTSIAYDAANNRLFVADVGTPRVLVYDVSTISDGMNAVNILGQANFTATTIATTQSGMKNPWGVVYDPNNQRLFVSDAPSNRVLVFDVNSISDGEPAVSVLGQTDFTSSGAPRTQSGMSNPQGLSYDTTNQRLYVPDANNNRLLVFDVNAIGNGENAINVLGELNFTSTIIVSQFSLGPSLYTAYDAANHRLFVSDTGANRVLVYDAASITNGEAAINVLGQPSFTTDTPATTASGMRDPRDLAYDADHQRLFVSDRNNTRVLVFDVNSITDGEPAVNVLGQPNFVSNGGAISQTGMREPFGIEYDAANQRLFVAARTNNCILVYDVHSITDGEAAVNILGQSSFTTSTAATSQSGLNGPRGLAYDATNHRLFVADFDNNRVVDYDVNAITDGEAQINVLGQGTFTTAAAATTQSGMNGPVGPTYEEATNRLFVGDNRNKRILVFDLSSQAATTANAIHASRGKAGVTSTYDINFTLSSPLNGTTTVTFAMGFTVTGAPTAGTCASGTIDTFAFNAANRTFTAVKHNCSGAVTLTGGTVVNPSTLGIYRISWVNDAPGEAFIVITSEDQVLLTASIGATMKFHVVASATNCNHGDSASSTDRVPTGDGGTVDLGVLTTDGVGSSDIASVKHICTFVSTNASSGYTLTVQSLNGQLKSTSAPADSIPVAPQTSGSATLKGGTPAYALCLSTANAPNMDTTTPAGSNLTATAPFNPVTCTGSSASPQTAGRLTTAVQTIGTNTSGVLESSAQWLIKASINDVMMAHTDYADTLTFIASGTF